MFFSKPGQELGLTDLWKEKGWGNKVKLLYGSENKMPKQNEWGFHWKGCGHNLALSVYQMSFQN